MGALIVMMAIMIPAAGVLTYTFTHARLKASREEIKFLKGRIDDMEQDLIAKEKTLSAVHNQLSGAPTGDITAELVRHALQGR